LKGVLLDPNRFPIQLLALIVLEVNNVGFGVCLLLAFKDSRYSIGVLVLVDVAETDIPLLLHAFQLFLFNEVFGVVALFKLRCTRVD